MTSPDDTPQPTEADREAAANVLYTPGTEAHQHVMNGEWAIELVAAFARHAQQVREEERERNAKVADAAAEEATRIALTHPEDSDSRSRMWARAREAQYIAADIRNLSLKDQADAV